MKLLLKEDVPNLGHCGDEVEVKDGYGRNYLVPQGKALIATPENLKAFKHQKNVVQAKQRKSKQAAKEIADKISGTELEFIKKMGNQGKLFGSVTSQDIAQALQDKGFEVDRRKINMPEPIRTLGNFKITYKLHKEVSADISVKVSTEETGSSPASEVMVESGEEPKKEDG